VDKDISQLKADIPRILVEIRGGLESKMAEAATLLYEEIVGGNPVDTGFSSSNWNISLTEPDHTVNGERDPKITYTPPPAVVPSNPDLESIFVANGVPYVPFLEEGTSQQAPSGFIRIASERIAALMGVG
jgi:hypothetical protein